MVIKEKLCSYSIKLSNVLYICDQKKVNFWKKLRQPQTPPLVAARSQMGLFIIMRIFFNLIISYISSFRHRVRHFDCKVYKFIKRMNFRIFSDHVALSDPYIRTIMLICRTLTYGPYPLNCSFNTFIPTLSYSNHHNYTKLDRKNNLLCHGSK